MCERAFFDPKAKQAATEAIKAIEAQTSAEVVVTLRHTSGSYRHADYLFGFLLSMATLLAMLFVDHEFKLIAFPIDVAAAFVFGAAICAYTPFLRRALTSKKLRASNVHNAARAAFVDHGVARCSGRWGVLVFVAMFERRVEVVSDIAIDPEKLGAPWKDAIEKMQSAIEAGPDLERFLVAFRGLGPVLSAAFPHRDYDVNGLPDEIDTDAPAEA